jgi:lysophosphatidylcholine acyltransferase / lyso-PAF acetyltransferase
MAANGELRSRGTAAAAAATASTAAAAAASSRSAPVEMTREARDREFIAAHGRLRRDVNHPIFDAFRRADDGPLTPLDYLKGALGFVLIPLRLSVAVALMVLPWLVIAVIGPPTNSDAHDPIVFLPPWRRKLCTLASRFLGRGLLFIMGFWRINGRDDPGYDDKAAQKATIVSNHLSLADPCLLAYLYGPSFVAKKAVALIPWVGRVGASQHAFYIDRTAKGGPSVTDIIVERQRLIHENDTTLPPVAIFSEGTTTSGKYILRMRTGAFVAGTPVVPVVIRYPYENFSPSYESIRTVPYLYRMLTQVYNSCYYLRLPVYYPSEARRPVLASSRTTSPRSSSPGPTSCPGLKSSSSPRRTTLTSSSSTRCCGTSSWRRILN